MTKRKRGKAPNGLDGSTLLALEQSQGWTSKRGDDLRSIAADRSEPEMAYLANKEIARRARGGEYYRNGMIVKRDASGNRVPVKGSEASWSDEARARYESSHRGQSHHSPQRRRGLFDELSDFFGSIFS